MTEQRMEWPELATEIFNRSHAATDESRAEVIAWIDEQLSEMFNEGYGCGGNAAAR